MSEDGPEPEPVPLERTVSWRELLAETTAALAAAEVEQPAAEARWIVETATGLDGAELVLALDDPATVRGVAHLDDMVARRTAGEPVQHVLGRWSFRSLDLLCDRRALIPRPETEQVVEVALAELDDVLIGRPAGHRPVVADLGTGSGAIALAVATERPGSDVWAVDLSPDALAVARANLAGLGMAGSRVRIEEGSWFGPLPDDLRGALDLVVTNPPYVADDEVLPSSVAEWEPRLALVSGPSGLEAYRAILAEAPAWLAPGGVLVAELGSTQAESVAELARGAGLVEVRVEADHAGLDRVLVARRPAEPVIAGSTVAAADPAALERAVEALLAGGTVLLPTDTVYGLAARAADPMGTEKIFAMKGRSEDHPLAVLVADAGQVAELVEDVGPEPERWMADLWPGPLTLVLRRSARTRHLELGGSDATIGVRCPDHAFVRALAARVGPIATTSANRTGQPTPASAREAAASLLAAPDLVVDGGRLATAASTVVDATTDPWRVLRAGPVSDDDLRGGR